MTGIAAHHRWIIFGVALSVFSCVVAIVVTLYIVRATSASQAVEARGQGTISAPLTPQNPAYALPHAASPGYISGHVASVNGDIVTLTVTAGPNMVHVTPVTKILQKGARKDAAEDKKEMDAFHAVLESAAGSDQIFFAPEPFETTPLKLSDLKNGDELQIRIDGTQAPTALVIYKITQQ